MHTVGTHAQQRGRQRDPQLQTWAGADRRGGGEGGSNYLLDVDAATPPPVLEEKTRRLVQSLRLRWPGPAAGETVKVALAAASAAAEQSWALRSLVTVAAEWERTQLLALYDADREVVRPAGPHRMEAHRLRLPCRSPPTSCGWVWVCVPQWTDNLFRDPPQSEMAAAAATDLHGCLRLFFQRELLDGENSWCVQATDCALR
jgi:hypothetical protein